MASKEWRCPCRPAWVGDLFPIKEKEEWVDKPGFVVDDHFSGALITQRLVAIYPRVGRFGKNRDGNHLLSA